jgi:hypothetical protein
LYGLEAINANNGWAISALGISIVFTGLTLLSLSISQIHKILDFWENRSDFFDRIKSARKNEKKTCPPLSTEFRSLDMAKTVMEYKLLTDRTGVPFSLPRVLKMAKKSGLHRPHSSINELLKAGLILPDGDGFFYWNE